MFCGNLKSSESLQLKLGVLEAGQSAHLNYDGRLLSRFARQAGQQRKSAGSLKKWFHFASLDFSNGLGPTFANRNASAALAACSSFSKVKARLVDVISGSFGLVGTVDWE